VRTVSHADLDPQRTAFQCPPRTNSVTAVSVCTFDPTSHLNPEDHHSMTVPVVDLSDVTPCCSVARGSERCREITAWEMASVTFVGIRA
jgi:hypothetical protein